MLIETEELLELSSAAKLRKMAASDFYYYVTTGKGPPVVMIDGKRYFKRTDVLAWQRPCDKRYRNFQPRARHAKD